MFHHSRCRNDRVKQMVILRLQLQMPICKKDTKSTVGKLKCKILRIYVQTCKKREANAVLVAKFAANFRCVSTIRCICLRPVASVSQSSTVYWERDTHREKLIRHVQSQVAKEGLRPSCWALLTYKYYQKNIRKNKHNCAHLKSNDNITPKTQ